MLIVTHFLIVAIILLLSNKILGGISLAVIILSFIFGVLIDIDHILFHYRQSVDWIKALFTRGPLREKKGSDYLHSVFQEPWFFFVLLGLSGIIFIFYRNLVVFIPAVCLGAHIFCDALMAFDNLLLWPVSKKKFRGFIPSGSLVEVIASVVLTIFIIFCIRQ